MLLPPISSFLDAVGHSKPECAAQQIAGARCSLLASVKLMLEASSPLLTSKGVATHGPFLVGEAVSSLKCAITIARWLPGTRSLVDCRLAAKLLLQCHTLLVDREVAAQLDQLQRYPLCSLLSRHRGPLTIAASLALLANGASHIIIEHMFGMFDTESDDDIPVTVLADCQQQLVALSAIVAVPPLTHSSVFELREHLIRPSEYEGTVLLTEAAISLAAAISHTPSLISQHEVLAATVAAGTVSTLVFAELDISRGRRPPAIESKMPGCMQYAAHAASFLHVLAQQLLKPNRANAEAARSTLSTQGAVQSLLRLLLWLSKPTTAVATASGVLAEALPTLLLMSADEEMRKMLAAAGGLHQWEPVPVALRRRLPRRMAARFLPEVDRISAAVAGCTAYAPGATGINAAAVAAAEAAMAELLQQVRAVVLKYARSKVRTRLSTTTCWQYVCCDVRACHEPKASIR